MSDNRKMPVKRLTELAMLTAVALIIFVIELQIPPLTAIPGVKLGLANIITVYCVYRYKPWEAALVVAVRVIIGAMFAASFSTILYSASGAFLCLLGIIPVSRLFPKLPIWACSVIGAVLHNIGQIAAVIVSIVIAFGYEEEHDGRRQTSYAVQEYLERRLGLYIGLYAHPGKVVNGHGHDGNDLQRVPA